MLSVLERARDWLRDPARVASIDRAWLRMDDPTNLMVVNALLLLTEPLPVEQLRELIAARLGWIRRMRSTVVPGDPWERWDERELEHHVVETTLAPPGDDATLREQIGVLISEPLDRARPLWQLWVIHGSKTPEGRPRSVVLARVHHSLGDGLAQLMVLLSLTAPSPSSSSATRCRICSTPTPTSAPRETSSARSCRPA